MQYFAITHNILNGISVYYIWLLLLTFLNECILNNGVIALRKSAFSSYNSKREYVKGSLPNAH